MVFYLLVSLVGPSVKHIPLRSLLRLVMMLLVPPGSGGCVALSQFVLATPLQ